MPAFGRVCALLPFVVGIEGLDTAEYTKRPEVFGWAWDYPVIYDNSSVLPFEEAIFVQGKYPYSSSSLSLIFLRGPFVASG